MDTSASSWSNFLQADLLYRSARPNLDYFQVADDSPGLAESPAAHLDERESRAARVRVAYLCRRTMLASFIPQVFSPYQFIQLAEDKVISYPKVLQHPPMQELSSRRRFLRKAGFAGGGRCSLPWA